MQLAFITSVGQPQQKPSEASKASVETFLFTCIKALEVIKRTTHFGQAVVSVFDKDNIGGIAVDVQVRTIEFPSVDQSIDSFRLELDSILANYDLQNISSAIDLLKKWNDVNTRDNSFWVSCHLVSTAFEDGPETYFKKIEFKDLIVEELKHLKYDWNEKLEMAKKNNSINIDDVSTYLDCFQSLRHVLMAMSTNRANFFAMLNKNIDFIYFVHNGVISPHQTKLHDKSDQSSKALFMFPMELALWSFVKKFEIGFELDIWAGQMVPYVLLWMHTILTHLNGNRVSYLTPFNPLDHKDNALTFNQLMYSNQSTVRTKQAIFDSYIDVGRLALIKSTIVIFWLLDQAGAVRKFMSDKELELAYDANIYFPMKDCFFVKKYLFNEAREEINKQIQSLGVSVGETNAAKRDIHENKDRSL